MGNIGYYTTSSRILKIAYSGVQTVGVINVGQGIHHHLSPAKDREIFSLMEFLKEDVNKKDKKDKKELQEILADKLVSLLAQEEKARRLSLFCASSLLTVQYFANAFIGRTPKDLKNIYIFLGSVNSIVLTYALFSRGKYESFYFGPSYSGYPGHLGLSLTLTF